MAEIKLPKATNQLATQPNQTNPAEPAFEPVTNGGHVGLRAQKQPPLLPGHLQQIQSNHQQTGQ